MWNHRGLVESRRTLALALVIVLVAAASPPWTGAASGQETGPASAELRALYEADQSDRRDAPETPEQWQEISARDAQRLARVTALIRTDSLSVAEDYYHAAMVLQHGAAAEHVLLAHILATAAAYQGDERGRWLSAAALDRYLQRTRMPQRLGTQYVKVSEEDPYTPDIGQPWSQGAYVRWLPDSIRELFGVIPLEEQEARIEAMNRPSGG